MNPKSNWPIASPPPMHELEPTGLDPRAANRPEFALPTRRSRALFALISALVIASILLGTHLFAAGEWNEIDPATGIEEHLSIWFWSGVYHTVLTLLFCLGIGWYGILVLRTRRWPAPTGPLLQKTKIVYIESRWKVVAATLAFSLLLLVRPALSWYLYVDMRQSLTIRCGPHCMNCVAASDRPQPYGASDRLAPCRNGIRSD